MKVISVQFTPWDKAYWFDPEDHHINPGDSVIVKTEIGVELGKVLCEKEINEKEIKQKIKPIVRKATLSDVEKIEQKNKTKKTILQDCKKLVEKHKLEIKIVDAFFSFDGGRITFSFTANGRVDFRELVKDLTHKFQKSIRLQQIGVRDEAKCVGDIGSCGKKICCKSFLEKLGQVNSGFAETQQIFNRGGDRLTGACGRLKCCLKYEQEAYEKLTAQLPKIGDQIKTEYGKGKVVRQYVLRQTVDVAIDGDEKNIVEVDV